MQVQVEGQPLPHQRSRKALWLLALLTLRHDKAIEREWLSGLLWPDVDQETAFANLRPVLSELRRGLRSQGDRLQSPDRHTLRLDLEGAKADVVTFDRAVEDHDLTTLEGAVSLYRGPLLEGCNEEWVFQERSVRERRCGEALQKLAENALESGDAEKAVGWYRRATEIDPLWETARRGLMEALAENGDTNEALQVYRSFYDHLRREMNTAPDEQTRALYARLREGASRSARPPEKSATGRVSERAQAPVVTGYLPHPLTELVGREDERDEVAGRLRESRLVTLTGFGGIGKTRLAMEVAAEVAREYPDGVWWVALESLTEGNQVTLQIASVLEVKEEPARLQIESVSGHLRRKRSLLVLDNCEHLREASADAAGRLLRECAGVRILATSREALGVPGETVWSVPPLATPDPLHLPQGSTTLHRVLMSYESVRLFVERAQAARKDFTLAADNTRQMAEVCSQLEGIPLALELAAARVKAMTLGQISERLHDHLSLVMGPSRPGRSRQQTLRATLDWSIDLLSNAERVLLRRLSVFGGGCLLEAVEQVCSGEGVEERQVLDLLTSLVDKSLVLFEQRAFSEGRYRLLEMVRQYAAEGLRYSDEIVLVKTRHRDWLLALAEESEMPLQGAEQAKWLQRLETEHDNLRAALAWSLTETQGAQAALRLAGALYGFWNIRGDFYEGRTYLAKALDLEGAQEPTGARAKALYEAGALAYRQGDYESARALIEEGLALYRDLGDRGGIALSLTSLASVAYDQGDYCTARSLNLERWTLFSELGDQREVAWSGFALGRIALQQGDYGAARTLLDRSLTIFRELGDRGGIAVCLKELGVLSSYHGDYPVARARIEQSLAIYREGEDRSGIAWSSHDLGYVALGEGDAEAADALFEESLVLTRELGDRYNVAKALQGLGRTALHRRDFGGARTLLKESLTYFMETGIKDRIDVSLDAMASLAHEEKRGQCAARLWGAATGLREEIGSPRPPVDQEKYDRETAQARAALGESVFTAAWEEGKALSWEQAVASLDEESPA
jgi:non-specific serine/threonine protein kinase